jgi:hypothetical protein
MIVSTKVARRRPRTYSEHGLTTMKSTLKRLGGRVIDGRTTLGKALASWRSEILQDMGGESTVSAQEKAILDLAVKTKLMLDSVDAWILTQPSLINHRKRALLPVVRERQQLADSLARYMQALGLQRRVKPMVDLPGAMAALEASERP